MGQPGRFAVERGARPAGSWLSLSGPGCRSAVGRARWLRSSLLRTATSTALQAPRTASSATRIARSTSSAAWHWCRCWVGSRPTVAARVPEDLGVALGLDRVWQAFADLHSSACSSVARSRLAPRRYGPVVWPKAGRFAVRVEIVEPTQYLAWRWATDPDVALKPPAVLEPSGSSARSDGGTVTCSRRASAAALPEAERGGQDGDVVPALRRTLGEADGRRGSGRRSAEHPLDDGVALQRTRPAAPSASPPADWPQHEDRRNRRAEPRTGDELQDQVDRAEQPGQATRLRCGRPAARRGRR